MSPLLATIDRERKTNVRNWSIISIVFSFLALACVLAWAVLQDLGVENYPNLFIALCLICIGISLSALVFADAWRAYRG